MNDFKNTLIRRLYSINIGRMTSRASGSFFNVQDNCPDYNPNFEYPKKKIATNIIGFEKITSRKASTKISATKNEDCFDYSRAYRSDRSQISRKTLSIIGFDHMIAREIDQALPLPSFMQVKKNLDMISMFENFSNRKPRIIDFLLEAGDKKLWRLMDALII